MGRILIFIFLILIALVLHYADNGDAIISLPKGLFDGIIVQAPPYAINAVVGSPGYPTKNLKMHTSMML
jgi:hypothetical protein